MSELVTIVRCPRCGSMDARSVEEIHVEFDRMKCQACGHEQICDDNQIRFDWNVHVPPEAVRRDQGHYLPFGRFRGTWRALGARDHGRDVFERLRVAYDEPHRAYHGARHIGACLRLLDDPAVTAAAERIDEVEMALWFHDAIYDTRAADNEEQSAVLAEEALHAAGVASDVAGRVAAHVRATREHRADTPDGRLVLDVDLSILGTEPEVFARFEEEIRREYAWVDETSYVAGRLGVLGRFEQRPFIYGTTVLRDRFEARARANIGAARSRLARVAAN